MKGGQDQRIWEIITLLTRHRLSPFQARLMLENIIKEASLQEAHEKLRGVYIKLLKDPEIVGNEKLANELLAARLQSEVAA